MFTVTGRIEGEAHTITWDNGAFSGDSVVLGRLEYLTARPPLSVKLTATGPRVSASETDVVAAYATARAAFAQVVSVDGDVPVFDPADDLDAADTIY